MSEQPGGGTVRRALKWSAYRRLCGAPGTVPDEHGGGGTARTATRVIIIGLAIAASAMAREEYTRNFDKTVTLGQGQALQVEHRMGDINIHTHPGKDLIIHAEIHVSAPDQTRAQDFANRIEIQTEQTPSGFSIRTHYPDTFNSSSGSNYTSYSVRYDLTMPESAPLELRSSFGAVSVSGLKANGNIRTSHGSLNFRDGQGTQRLEDSFASVDLSHNAGDVAIEDTNGSVRVDTVKGALTIQDRFGSVSAEQIARDLTITNTNGSVDVSDCGGSGSVRNAFGNVTARNIGGDLTIHNGNGKVEATNVKGAAELNTSYGEVRFSDIGRGVSVRANNSRIEGSKVKGAIKIENSFGAVSLAQVDGAVDVHSGNGEVSVNQIHGEAGLRTSYATVDASDIGGALTVSDNNGSVHAINVRAGATVKTSYAGVELERVAGAIDVDDQNGAVEATGEAAGACQPILIHTSFSPIRVHLHGTPSYRVTATTSFGKIQTDFPLTVTGSMSSNNLNGTIGDGRCELRLSDNNGTIEILNAGGH